MAENALSVTQLERLSKLSRRTITYLRSGASPTLASAAALAEACSAAVNRPVALDELFDLQRYRRRRLKRSAA